MENPRTLTELLRLYSGGDRTVGDILVQRIYPKLREIAVQQLKREGYKKPFTPTELINQAWARGLLENQLEIRDRGDFFALTAVVMRHAPVDQARRRLSVKQNSGSAPLSFGDLVPGYEPSVPSCEAIVEAGILMEKLEGADPVLARIVDLHYFVGFGLEEITAILGLTHRQVRHRWKKGENWLKDRITKKPKD